jgi:hypothetical protein
MFLYNYTWLPKLAVIVYVFKWLNVRAVVVFGLFNPTVANVVVVPFTV